MRSGKTRVRCPGQEPRWAGPHPDCHSTVALQRLWLDTSVTVVWSAGWQRLVRRPTTSDRFGSAEMAAIRGGARNLASARGVSRTRAAPRHQTLSGRVLREAAESVAGALLARPDERAVQDRGSGEVERFADVPQAAGDLRVVDEPRSWSERVVVVSESCEGSGRLFARIASSRFSASTVRLAYSQDKAKRCIRTRRAALRAATRRRAADRRLCCGPRRSGGCRRVWFRVVRGQAARRGSPGATCENPRVDARATARSLSGCGGRAAVGAACFAAPELTTRVWSGDDADRTGARPARPGRRPRGRARRRPPARPWIGLRHTMRRSRPHADAARPLTARGRAVASDRQGERR